MRMARKKKSENGVSERLSQTRFREVAAQRVTGRPFPRM